MKKQKLLFLSQSFPYPADGGGKIKSLISLLTLAKKFEVSAIFVSEYEPSKLEIDKLKKWGVKEIKVFYRPEVYASVKDDLLGLLSKFLHGIPHYIFQYSHPPAEKYINNLIPKLNPEIIHVDHLNLAQYLPKEKNEKWILEHHNVESYLYWTRFANTTRITRKIYLLIEMVLTFWWERNLLKKFDHIFAISEPEKRRALKMFGPLPISAQPLIYPPNHQVIKNRQKRKKNKNPEILFIGAVSWPPNEDAVEWFLSEIFPLVKTKITNVHFTVVGRTTPELLKKMPKVDGVSFVGYQKNIDPYLINADVFVLPFRMGGGVRLKALTAMTAGVPIVSTKLGVEGLDIETEKESLITNNAKEFSKKVISLIKSQKNQVKMFKHQLNFLTNHSVKKSRNYLLKYLAVTKKPR